MKLAIIGGALLLISHATVGRADPDEAAVHVAAAEKAHAAGDFDTALVELQAAYAFDPKPDLLYAIGQVYSKLGKCPEAKTFFDKFRVASKDPQVSAVVAQAISACKPHDAEVKPPPLPRDEPHPLPHDDLPPPVVEHHGSPWYTDLLGDALVVGGAAVAGVGLSFYLGARSDLDKAETASTLATYQSLVDDAHDKRTRAIIVIGAGSALVIGGVVRYILRDDGSAEQNRITIAPTHGGAMLTWGTSL